MSIPVDALKDKCVVRRRTEGAFGPEYGTGSEHPCYSEPGAEKITTSEGVDIVADAVFYLQPDAAIGPGDLIEYAGGRYEVVRVDKFRPKGQPHHAEVFAREVA